MFNNTAIKKVIIARNNKDLAFFLTNFRSKNEHKTIGFIPTMGALHNGHMSLIKEAKAHCEFVVCSLFVNPTQFNDSKDLDKYPRTEKEDLTLLELNNCDLVFIPSESDIYPKKIKDYSINFNGLDKVMEGKYRDGHFNGVCMVVERFFNLIEPNFAFFGRKDFQQVAIIKHMVKYLMQTKLNILWGRQYTVHQNGKIIYLISILVGAVQFFYATRYQKKKELTMFAVIMNKP